MMGSLESSIISYNNNNNKVFATEQKSSRGPILQDAQPPEYGASHSVIDDKKQGLADSFDSDTQMNKLHLGESIYQNEPISPSNDQSIEVFQGGGEFDLDNVFFDNNNAMKDDIKQQMGRNESVLLKKRRKTTVPKLT